jgi:hypothetical protein
MIRRLLNKLRGKKVATGPPPETPKGDEKSPGTASYAADQPIRSREEDRFNRWPFAKRIADTLARRDDPSSLVLGIYGVWGDGKTSTLRLMEEALKEHAEVVCVKFNPWHFESQAQLLRGFFATLAEDLGRSMTTRKEEIGKILERYSWILSLASASVGGGTVTLDPGEGLRELGRTLSTVELEELRERLQKILRESGKRVVVLIDDMDRLDRREVQAIFKLVKLSAGFERTSYVLAFDEEMVAASLGEQYGEGGSEGGRKFLEKIVQVPLHLPAADDLSLRKLVFEGVNAATKLAGIDLTEEQVQAFVRHFVDGLELRLETPRQAKRYGNVLAFSLPILKGEVNHVDQMLVEGIRVFYPKLYVAIRQNPDVFLGADRDTRRGEVFKKRVTEIVDRGLEGLEARDKERVQSRLLAVLFPRLKSVFGGASYGSEWEKEWDREQRIASRQYFDRYFSYSVPPGDVSDQVMRDLLEKAGQGSEADVDETFKGLAERGALRRVVPKLRRQEDLLNAVAARTIVRTVTRNGHLLPRERTMFGFDSTFTQAAILVGQLLLRVPAGAERDALAEQVIREAEFLPFAFECFRYMRKGKKDPESERIISDVAEREAGRLLVERVKAWATETPPWRELPQDTPGICWVWEQYGEAGDVGTYLETQFAANRQEVPLFLTTYVAAAWGMESGLPRKGDFERNAYDMVRSLIDPERIVGWLREIYGDDVDRGDHYQPDTVPFEKRIAVQFGFIHRKVKEEAQSSASEANSRGENAEVEEDQEDTNERET